MKKIIIVVDLGHFKAYDVSDTPTGSKIDLVASYDLTEAHGKFSEKFSDANGRFGAGGGKNGAASGNGESHNTVLELEKRAVKQISKNINSLISQKAVDRWHLAAAKGINSQIVENLDPEVRARLGKNMSSDLTKASKTDLLNHFE